MKMITKILSVQLPPLKGGAIGIIRVSGPRAIEITSHLFIPVQGKPLTERKPYTLTFGKILSPQGEVIDEVLVSLFRAPILIPVKTAQKSCVMVHPIFYNK